METFYNLVEFIYSNLSSLINNVAIFMTRDLGDSIALIITDNAFWKPILQKLIDITDILGVYNMTPLEIVLGVGLPIVLIYTLIKWLLPTS